MDINEARKVLKEYFNDEDLCNEYKKQKFDHSAYDTNKKFELNAKLLKELASKILDQDKRKALLEAAEEFERQYNSSRFDI